MNAFKNIVKKGENSDIQDTITHLCFRYLSFPDESKLWSEVHSILEALQNDTGDSQNTFLTGMFPSFTRQNCYETALI